MSSSLTNPDSPPPNKKLKKEDLEFLVHDVPQVSIPEDFCIGIIGLGDMGFLYAKSFSEKGMEVIACDQPSKFEEVQEKCIGTSIKVVRDGYAVARRADFLIFRYQPSIDSISILFLLLYISSQVHI